MNYKGAIFDLDGTVFESMHVWRQIDVDFLGKRNLDVPVDYLDQIVSMNFEEAAIFTINRFGFKQTKEEIIKEWFDMAVTAYGNDVDFKPGAKQYLDYLKEKNIPLAIATSSDEQLYMAAFKNLGIENYFDIIVTAKDVGCGKNKPDIYIKAADMLGLKPEECVVFEDIYKGMTSAKKAGFFTVMMEDESSIRQRELIKENCDIYITDFSQLLKDNIPF